MTSADPGNEEFHNTTLQETRIPQQANANSTTSLLSNSIYTK